MPEPLRSHPAGGLRPRGPLPARVYWTRRLVVLGTALLLVVAVARLLGGGSDGADSADSGETAAAASSTTREDGAGGAGGAPAGSAGPTAGAAPAERRARPRRAEPKPTRTPLAEPEGRCEDSDVRVVPSVTEAVGGAPITLQLELRTVEAAACWWLTSPDSLTLRIRSGDDEIWSSRQCPRAVPRRSVVVRQAVGKVVTVTWSGRRSDDECSRLTAWALPGFYHLEAAALAGEPADVQFEVTAPRPEVVERTVQPEPRSSARPRSRRDR